jgi:hypothetical protein
VTENFRGQFAMRVSGDTEDTEDTEGRSAAG